VSEERRFLEFVLIASEAEEWVEVPTNPEYPLYIEDDIIGKTLELIRDNPVIQLNLVFFVPAHSVSRLSGYCRELHSDRILSAFVAVSEGKHLSNIPLDLDAVLEFRTSTIRQAEFSFIVKKGFSFLQDVLLRKMEHTEGSMKLLDAWNDQESLIHIGKSLSLEKDPDRLLRTILYFAKKITGADAGSIFIVEENGPEKKLRFKYSHTFSKDLSYEAFTLPFDKNSIAGYVAVTGHILNIPDVYKLDESDPVSFNKSFDTEHGYRTKSMLVVPMRNHIDEVIGVIQLINSKETEAQYTGNEAFEVLLENPEDFEEKVGAFKPRYESLMEAIAGQAATALENNRMLIQIERQFEEFVKASVTAIESRDPATSGHSFRVAEMCVNMAHIINKSESSYFKDIEYTPYQIKELEFAALLHDFGKVYINPAIFQKAKKLFERDFEYLVMRLNFLYRTIELSYADATDARSASEKEQKLDALKRILNLITQLNEPMLQDGDPEEKIHTILEMQDELRFYDLEDNTIPLLEKNEINNLKIKRGSLNSEERSIIESHVEHTYTFVSKIPWPEEYKNIPEIARKHHEKLDGSGYPMGLAEISQIPLGSRIMTIADMFDALSATDRPYKKAVPLNRIFSILREEAEEGKLDEQVVDLFIERGGWKIGEEMTEKQVRLFSQEIDE
jgi:HD-GYP domain-containing protein (c-di-GMP phosphodiesterase class II)